MKFFEGFRNRHAGRTGVYRAAEVPKPVLSDEAEETLRQFVWGKNKTDRSINPKDIRNYRAAEGYPVVIGDPKAMQEVLEEFLAMRGVTQTHRQGRSCGEFMPSQERAARMAGRAALDMQEPVMQIEQS